MAQVSLVKIAPCQVNLWPYVISVSNSGEYLKYLCDGSNQGRCCSAVLDLPDGERKEIQCPYTSGMNAYKYVDALAQTLFSPLFALGLVKTPRDPLLLDLLNFIVDSTIKGGHACPKDRPSPVPVAYIHVAKQQQQPHGLYPAPVPHQQPRGMQLGPYPGVAHQQPSLVPPFMPYGCFN